jgi:cell fate (sporulation/competence/biofilm development) regulator YlbF (YheA/YmcA/DUF963 family)
MANNQIIHEAKTLDDLKLEAQALAELMHEQDVFKDFMEAYRSMQASGDFQSLTQEIENLQIQAEAAGDEQKEMISKMDIHIQKLESLPEVRRYYEMEERLCRFLSAVDDLVSQEAGIGFAIHARRSKCSCNS